MKVSDYIVDFLAQKGITDVFGYPGGMVTHLMDSFSKQNAVSAHLNYHEQASAFAACGYAQVSHRPGVAFATSGPGATNFVTGIANAYFDSIPCLFITGQVNTYESKKYLKVRQYGFQETDIVSIVRPVTKYAALITKAEDIRYELEKAYALALSGRPGPVLLDIPMNIQRADIELSLLKGFEDMLPVPDFSLLPKVLEQLYQAKRPCILVGSGVKTADTVALFRRLAKTLSIPVVSSMIAVDVCDSEVPYYGFTGAYGDRRANFILAKSDLIVSLGSRMSIRQVGVPKENFSPQARLIRFDVDKDEMTNIIKQDEMQINIELRHALEWLSNHAQEACQVQGWLTVCNELSKTLSGIDDLVPHKLIHAISDIIPDHTVVTTDVGQNQVWVSQAFKAKRNQTLLFSGGHGAMGYSLPAAIGAYYASKNTVVSFNGDGGFQMNLQELQFIKRENLPIKIIVFNNKALGMIRHFQEMYFERNYFQTVETQGYQAPSFAKIAYAYDIPYHLVESREDLHADLLSGSSPTFIEVFLPGDSYVYPKLAMGKPNHDQEPLLDRGLYERLMQL